MSSTPCPNCGKEIRFVRIPVVGDKKLCLSCSSRLEVTALEPELALKVSDEAAEAMGSSGSGGISEDY